MFGFLKKIFGSAHDRLLNRYRKIVVDVNRWDEKFKSLSDEQLKGKTEEFRQRLQKGETLDQILPEAYAVVKNVCRRLSGTEVHVSGYNQRWDMVPYDVQILGGIAMHSGAISEMHTGEGKTLTAVMPLYLNALTGKPVHLITVNDYLAQRDCEWVGTVLRWLGLTTGALTNSVPIEGRKQIYACDVVYGTASEFGFDYLRDNSMAMSKDEQVQRGYYFAIIDEVDSILIDEARTPLIISGPVPDSRQMYDELKEGVAELVRRQRDLCSRLATDARKVFDQLALADENAKKDKKQEEAEQEAYRKLWLVGKGTPQNKILKRLKENPDVRAAIDKWDLYYHAEQNKEERIQTLAELYMIVDEKGNEYELTDKGIGAWQTYTGGIGSAEDFIMMDISDEYIRIDEDASLDAEAKMARKMQIKEEDAKRKERAHNLRQLLRAHLLMEKDVDYIIYDNKIVIIDENTGRPQPGRRFSDGLHQAIEAKEGVEIQKETQTYATITLQNFFRMYEKLSGMTGTATTEANEFKEIYKLDVLEIPTHRPNKRQDFNDEIYMTEREKYNAMLKEVREIHEKGRPILIGTESVEVSEKLSRIFKQNGLEHTVLNAKQNEREAEIVAQAGKRGSITIATNMAGRGTDIKLEAGVAEVGGLYVMGTTRHQSRRIDRQLRGRCARQGDPGNSKFYISFEDALLRLFASPRITGVLQKFRPPEGEPISARMLNKSIETAQKRVEQRNYTMRKHTLEYDDVMNKQRQEIYAFRNEIIGVEDIEPVAIEVIESVCALGADKFFQSRSDEGGWDPEGYRQWLLHLFPVTFDENAFDQEHMEIEEIEALAAEKVVEAFKEKLARENAKVPAQLIADGEPARPAHSAVRNLMIRKTDQMWQEHLLRMDHLRSDVTLRAVGQRDPLMEFKHEAFALFDELSRTLRTEVARSMFRFEIIAPQQTLQQLLQAGLRMETNRSLFADLQNIQPMAPEADEMDESSEEEEQSPEAQKAEPIVVGQRTGRNDLCPCGSGKKYKKCCHQSEMA
ncbi:Preprotein translocase subunit secA [Candidatus Protochlamydia naegleriophila]|uniref:Protein translocase subunit SecA n=1 Tax=Candidatus Protochlamydia naegleriophila TaxID=389348 RepID=A0A0U5JA85_9BACT|nr:preprotein translocase subunit SecA [Candidatus Protochlamydia naegleriophila]CUI15770.1 Preprotein translocase subunit secA [Candidatus Protochlamydia naegleriophila]